MTLDSLVRGSDRTADFEGATLKKRTDFFFGTTLTSSDFILLWSSDRGGDGNYYQWRGSYPKVVPPGSTPATSGGISPTGWRLVSDLVDAGQVVDVRRDFGAVGNGVSDDTAAFVAALQYACATLNVTVRIPAGLYRVSGNVPISNMGTGTREDRIKVSLIGDGASTEILHFGNSPLFVADGLIYDFSARDFTVRNKRTSSSGAENAVFRFPEGNCNSDFENIKYLPDTATNVPGASFYLCGAGKTNDSVNFTNCYGFVDQIGYRLGAGSTVYIYGGRMASSFPAVSTGTGLLLTGGMGGVWVFGTDFIGLGYGIRLTQAAGVGTNREIFLVSACVDSCAGGISIEDGGSYTSWSGAWAASCTGANINFAPTSDAAILNISGGTIFNAGANDPSATGLNYGISINSYGRVEIDGVCFRNNRGRAVSCNDGAKGRPTKITNCSFYSNGTAGRSGSAQAFLAGNVSFVDNELDNALASNVLLDVASVNLMNIRGNRGYRGTSLRAGPSIPATGVDATNSTGQRLIGYFRDGSVTSYFVNGAAVYSSASAAPINAQLVLNPGDTFRINYASAPNVQWYFE